MVSPEETAALSACERTPDRLFQEIARDHGIDRERLQELWFDRLLVKQSQRPVPQPPHTQEPRP